MKYFAIDQDGAMWNLCDCGDFEAAEESAADMDVDALWIADEQTAYQWLNVLHAGLLQ